MAGHLGVGVACRMEPRGRRLEDDVRRLPRHEQLRLVRVEALKRRRRVRHHRRGKALRSREKAREAVIKELLK